MPTYDENGRLLSFGVPGDREPIGAQSSDDWPEDGWKQTAIEPPDLTGPFYVWVRDRTWRIVFLAPVSAVAQMPEVFREWRVGPPRERAIDN